MRIGIQTWGTEGDFRPFVALAQTLQRRGHAVELLYTGVEGKDYTHLPRGAGVPVRLIDHGYFASHRAELAALARESMRLGNPRKQLERILHDLMDPLADAMLDGARDLAGRCDVLVGHVLVPSIAVAAEERGVPFVQLALQPLYPSAHYPPAGAPPLGAWGNRLLWRLANHVMRSALLPRTNRMRERCGMAPLRRFVPLDLGRPRRALVALSPTLFPRPPDWAPQVDVSGFLSLSEAPAAWEPEPRLRAFLDAGPPVFLSFGSMFGMNDEQTLEALQVFAEALALAKARGVIQAPAAISAQAPQRDDICYIERAPHDRLFPRCAAIVHHGGAGTTQSALLSGRGSIVVPHAADQFYFGDLLRARGVASRPLRRTGLAAGPLARRIRAVLDDGSITRRAEALAAALRAEDGCAATAAQIEAAAAAG